MNNPDTIAAFARGAGRANDQLVQEALAIFNGLPESRQREIMEEQRKGVEQAQIRDAERRRLEAAPAEALLAALDSFTLHVQMRDVEPRNDDTWLLIDAKTADPDTNWPGELVSEHRTHHEARVALMNAAIATAAPPDFQARCQAWLSRVTEGDATDLAERRARFAEEAMEWVQSIGATAEEMHQLVDYVFSRPAGDPPQEIGGMLTTAAVLAEITGYDLMGCGERELARVQAPEVIAKIRGKRSRRHGRGPLPGTTEADLVPTPLVFEGPKED